MSNAETRKGRKLTKRDLAIRNALADYMWAEGCSCCRSEDRHAEAKERLAKLLNVPTYSDGSGWDFSGFRSAK